MAGPLPERMVRLRGMGGKTRFMKIMRQDSCREGWADPHGPATMAIPFSRRSTMKWQTPQAQDFRFGFEITMYIAAR
ncbi:pyrroloquinoline quinone precursor peptide PqqA [Ramlibacter agri]|nr:pyrroloquinoline quinone precursor peptide PqqA [Ramlibacter agri]